jgi:hypothetical protein
MKNTRDVARPGLVTKQHVRFEVTTPTALKVWKGGRLTADRPLARGAEVLGNPARPRDGHVLVWHNGRGGTYLGAGWVAATALRGGAELLSAAKRVKQQMAPRGPRLAATTVNTACTVTEGSEVGELYIRHGQSKPADKYWHYTPRAGRVNICRNLPQGEATAIANDVLVAGQPFFVEPGTERTVALYAKASKRPRAWRKWVYGCMADGNRMPDRGRPGWVPKQALRGARR